MPPSVGVGAGGRPRRHHHLGLHLLAEELRDTQHRWQALTGDDPTSDVRAVLSWSYQTLTPGGGPAVSAARPASGPDIAAPAAASLASIPTTTVKP